jgi:hypothetical protein
MKQAIEFAREFVKEHPHLKHQVIDLLELCQSEIEEGGSPQHEVELCIGSIKELVEEEN